VIDMPLDFKKTDKDLYQPSTAPSVVDVPAMMFIAVDGQGDPNTSAEYAAAIEVLYGLSYSIKMGNKAVLEYVVPPLEGLWWLPDGGSFDPSAKDSFCWTVMIRQPDFVTPEVFGTALEVLAKKKPKLDTSGARLMSFTEGLCAQAMHIGPYDDEPATVAAMELYAAENGYVVDFSDVRHHHEIYLSDPRKVAPEKMKTVVRHPVRKAS